MAETEIEIYVVEPNDELIDKVEVLLCCDNNTEFLKIAAGLGADPEGALPVEPEFCPDGINLFKGYLQATVTAGSDGNEIAQAWTRYLSTLIPTCTVHTWGHQDSVWEFWYQGRKGLVEHKEDEPDGNDKVILESIYSWWHNGMPPGVKTGLLARKFKHPGRKPAKRKRRAKNSVGSSYKNLYEAWQAGDYEYLEKKITKRNLYSNNTFDTNPEMTIQFAMRKQDDRLVQIVLDAGFDCDHTMDGGWNILHWLCNQVGETANRYVPLFVDRGTKVDLESGEAWKHTPLYFACKQGHANAVRALIAAGANVNHADLQGRTPLFQLAFADDSAAATTIIDMLAEAGADLSHRDNGGATALHEMVRWQRSPCTKHLVDLGLDINDRNSKGQTPLFGCQFEHQMDIARLCLELGADPLKADNDGRRAFDESTHLQALLLHGSYIEATDIREA